MSLPNLPAVCAGAIILVLASAAVAQNAPQTYYQDLATAAGQVDALSLACGKTDQATVRTHRNGLRQQFAGKGLPTTTFDRLYDTAFDDVTAKARANPAATRQGCNQLAQGKAAGAPVK